MSIVSATKYYSGHSDVMGGSLAVNKRVFKQVEKANKISGFRLGPDDSYLIIRGLRTLDVRLDRHQENAKKVASFLSRHKKVQLLYPFKKGSFNYDELISCANGELFGPGKAKLHSPPMLMFDRIKQIDENNNYRIRKQNLADEILR